MEPTPTNPTLEELLHHADWLTSLTRILVDDATTADDVVQETWLALLRRRASKITDPRRYLQRVARHEAWRQRARVARRRERSSPSLDDRPIEARAVLERVELQARVASAVTTLEEPYRSCVLLRFFEGLPPRRIAVDLQAPVETVKARIKRGLALLRGRLQEEFGDGNWRAVLGPLVARVPIGGPTISVPLPWIGVLIVNAKALLLASCIALVSLGLLFVRPAAEGQDIAPTRANGAPSPLTTADSASAPAQVDRSETTEDESSIPVPVTSVPAGILRVQVHSSTGDPCAGIPVALASELRAKRTNRVFVSVLHQHTTDALGSVAFPEFQAALQTLDPMARCVVFVLGHLRSVPRHAIEGTEVPPEPIQLTLPNHGSIRVRLVDALGESITQNGTVSLIEVPGLTPSPADWSPLHANPHDQRPLERGKATFPVVEPDTRVRLQVDFPSATGGFGMPPLVPPREFAGPRDGEDIEITFPVTNLPLVTGRMHDAQGVAMANQTLSAWYVEERATWPRRSPLTLHTDAQGTFRFLVSSTPEHGDSRRFLLIAECRGTIGDFTLPGGDHAYVPLPTTIQNPLELGNLQLVPEPVLVAGQVLSPSGEPVSGLSIHAAPPWRITSAPLAAGTNPCALHAMTDPHGRFRFHGISLDEKVKVIVRSSGYLTYESIHPLGSEDVRVELVRAASLQGMLRTDAALAELDLEVRMEDAAGALRKARPGPDGAFAFEGLSGGEYSLQVGPRNTDRQGALTFVVAPAGKGRTATLFEMPIEVESGRTHRPQALDPLDLRGLFRPRELVCLDENGAPLAHQYVLIHGPRRVEAMTDAEGHFCWSDREPEGDPRWVTSLGRRAQRVDLRSTQSLRLEAGLSVSVALTSMPELPTGRGFLGVTLLPLDPPEGIDIAAMHRMSAPRILLEGPGPIEQRVPWPGRYRVVWERGQKGLMTKIVGRLEAEEVHIVDSPRPQHLTIEAPDF